MSPMSLLNMSSTSVGGPTSLDVNMIEHPSPSGERSERRWVLWGLGGLVAGMLALIYGLG
jgi:hypothetical protein